MRGSPPRPCQLGLGGSPPGRASRLLPTEIHHPMGIPVAVIAVEWRKAAGGTQEMRSSQNQNEKLHKGDFMNGQGQQAQERAAVGIINIYLEMVWLWTVIDEERRQGQTDINEINGVRAHIHTGQRGLERARAQDTAWGLESPEDGRNTAGSPGQPPQALAHAQQMRSTCGCRARRAGSAWPRAGQGRRLLGAARRLRGAPGGSPAPRLEKAARPVLPSPPRPPPLRSRGAARSPRIMAGRADTLWLSPWLWLWLCTAGLCAAAELRLTLLHTNDVHGRVEAQGAGPRRCAGDAPGCFGGVARRAARVAAERAAHPNVLLLDAGDQYQGTVWFSRFKGREAVHFMNLLRYDAMALGNHEFDEGVSGLLDPLLKNANFTVLSGNIKGKTPLGNEMMKYVNPFKIVHFDSESVGIVGYTTQETSFLSQPGNDIIFEDEIEALQVQVNKLTAMGVNKIIALGHSGFTVDKNIAQKVKGVDVVIGGHTNTFLYTGTPPSTEVPAGPYPFMVDSDDGRKVPVVQAYAYGKYLGYLNVTFDKKGNVVEAVGNPILLDSSIPEDEHIKEEVEKWRENLGNYSKEIGKTNVYLNGTSQACRFHECNMGNLLCDAVLYENVGRPDKKSWNHVSMCILNGGGIRSPIDEQSTNGSITVEDLLSVLPFGGRFDMVKVKGSTLKEAFEHSVHRYGRGSGELLQVGGIHVVYDLSRAPGSRVVSLEVLCTACRVPSYIPLHMDEIYNVTLPSYMLFGGDGYHMLKDKNMGYSKGEPDIEVVSRYLQRMERVYPAVEGRIKFSSGSLHKASLTLISALFTATFLHT
ncbi:PREDICTED: 5'-nucleotidase [Lepidothrix coronata]|uniref:5'-nucleotidase n=1 Tax=Lepidothrix coronata TaxID=321398 RepID=A0A6J0I089_9PASS|nr:PREDICTED: 5'-nucleotidase [Lepidothrix coronata]